MTLLPENLLPSPSDVAPGAQADALEACRELSMPSTDQEVWRYSRIDDLSFEDLHLAAPPDPSGPAPRPELAERLLDSVGSHEAYLELVCGRALRSETQSSQVTITEHRVGETTGPAAVGMASGNSSELGGGDEMALLNLALAPAQHTVSVAAGTHVTDPVVVMNVGGDEGAVATPRLRFEVAEGASATAVHILATPPGHQVFAPVTEVVVGDAANFRLVTIHTLGDWTWALHRLVTDVQRDARLDLQSVGLGGHYSRMRIDASLLGQGSFLDNRALYFGTQSSMHDFRVHQRHAARSSTSKLNLRGAVRDTAQGVFTGVVHIDKGAKNANGSQDAKHLILEDGAHVDSIPTLEIEENEVSCSHASTIGPLQEDQVFYLESRGIPTTTAMKLIARGFLREGEAGIRPRSLATAIGQVLSDELARDLTDPLVR